MRKKKIIVPQSSNQATYIAASEMSISGALENNKNEKKK